MYYVVVYFLALVSAFIADFFLTEAKLAFSEMAFVQLLFNVTNTDPSNTFINTFQKDSGL